LFLIDELLNRFASTNVFITYVW